MDLSFSGGGFMGCYYFGVVNCLNKYIPRERVRRVAGASSGSLIAAYYLMDLSIDKCLKAIIDMLEDIRRRPLGVFDRSNQVVDVLPRLLDATFPEDAHKRVNGRLFVCMTRLRDMKLVVVNEFESKQELIDALNCSCFIPLWSGDHVSTYRGAKYIDGGFNNNLPVFDDHTIRICCFAGHSDIAPKDRGSLDLPRFSFQGMPFVFNWGNMTRLKSALWPPTPSYIIQLLERGFHDAKDFILTNDLIQCPRCFGQLEEAHEPIYSRLKNPTISPAPSPQVSRANSLRRQKEGGARELKVLELERVNGSEEGAAEEQRRLNQRHRQRSVSLCSDETGSSSETSLHSTCSSGVFSSSTLTNNEPGAGPKERRSLGAALRRKLNALTRNKSKNKDESERRNNNKNQFVGVPSILVQEAPTAVSDSSSSASSTHGSPALPRQANIKIRRNSQQRVAEPLAKGNSPLDKFVRRMSTVPDLEAQAAGELELHSPSAAAPLLEPNSGRFAPVPSPLPSCPPSPSLNRRCAECLRMRQEARLDLLDEQIVRQAEIYRDLDASHDPTKEFAHLAAGGGLRAKLGGLVRSLTGQKAKSSYTFADLDPCRPQASQPVHAAS